MWGGFAVTIEMRLACLLFRLDTPASPPSFKLDSDYSTSGRTRSCGATIHYVPVSRLPGRHGQRHGAVPQASRSPSCVKPKRRTPTTATEHRGRDERLDKLHTQYAHRIQPTLHRSVGHRFPFQSVSCFHHETQPKRNSSLDRAG